MKKFIYVLVAFLLVILSKQADSQEYQTNARDLAKQYLIASQPEKINVYDLAKWRLLGIGEVKVLPNQEALQLTEGSNSKGIVLLSPKKYGKKVVITFMIKPLKYEGVGVVLLSASAIDGREIQVPQEYDGNFEFWTAADAKVRNYAFAFHTGYHQPNAFLRKNPGAVELTATKDVATEQKWYQIEIGRDGSKLWMRVDGKSVLEAKDPEALPAGHIGLRLRGPGDGSFSALYKNLRIREFK